jgi:dihydrofolate reductase
MKGGTTFHFVTDGIESALTQAKAAAAGKDVRIGGGAATVRAYLATREVDEMHLAVSPVFLGRGESLFADLDLAKLGYVCKSSVAGKNATHLTIVREG